MRNSNNRIPAISVLVAIVVSAPLAAGAGDSQPTVATPTSQNVQEQRKQAAHRKRRIVMDNDGNEPVYYIKEATAKALLDCRTTGLVGTQVDTIVYCTWSSGFGLFTHATKVGQVFTCTAEGFSKNKTQQFIDQGTDPLDIMVKFCRAKGIEIFWSMRMNDTHDGSTAWYGPLMLPELKKLHPEYLVGARNARPKVGAWTAMDYTRPEVRDLAFRYIEEVCRNYDIDGIMLDYFRHPVLFKSQAVGGVAGEAERDMMTDLMGRIRRMADEVGAARGRPILIATRVPDSADYCKAMGIDLVRWLKEDLVDLLVVSGYFRLSPWKTSVELAHQYDVPLLACLSESRLTGEAGELRKSAACYRGRAMCAWADGVDGIYTFNLFDPRSSLWREMGDPATVRSYERMYSTGARGVKVIRYWMVNGERFLQRPTPLPEKPASLKPGESAQVELEVGEQFGARDRVAVTLELQTEPTTQAGQLDVKMNGTPLKYEEASESWLRFSVKPEIIVKGTNRIEVTSRAVAGQKPVTLRDLVLWVRPIR